MKNARIPSSAWEHNRSLIQDLYLKQNKELEGEDGVVNIMKVAHGFVAR